MKQKVKFFVMVFGVSLAIFSSVNMKATVPPNDDIRCTSDSEKGCVRVAAGGWLIGTKVIV